MSQPRRIVLHVGLPKTATSSLQLWCDRKRERLAARGVSYPKEWASDLFPKHQFLVGGLLSGDLRRLAAVLAAEEAGTVLLSAEGLTNHLYDFPPPALEAFRAATAADEVAVFMVSRAPASWTRSYYKQAVLNPPRPEYDYATALDYEAFRERPRVRRLTDLPALRRDLEAAYGAREVVVAAYEDDWMAAFRGVLGLADTVGFEPLAQVHTSVPDAVIALVRRLNAMQLPEQARADFLALVQAAVDTDHNALKHFYRAESAAALRGEGNRAILRRLRAEAAGPDAILAAIEAFVGGPPR